MRKFSSIFIIIILLGTLGPVLVYGSPENPNESCRYDDGGNIPEGNAPCVDRGGNPNNPPGPSYNLLAPLPNPFGGPGIGNVPVGGENALGQYLNVIIRLAIGIAAVLAVVMIVMGGIQYMTTELVSGKEEGKKRITNAIMGLLVALGAYLILFTINPDLLNTNLNIAPTTIQYIESFEISGALVRTPGGPSFKVDFRSEAYPAAIAASQATGVDVAFILAIFAQETNSGKNTGGCRPANANMYPEDLAALATIVGSSNVSNTNVSCPSGGGRGGAIGLMQFRPTTWLATRDRSTSDPWNVNDALMVGAILLRQNGAVDDPRNAACKYYSGSPCTAGRTPPNAFYGDQVMARMASIRQQIDAQEKGFQGSGTGGKF